MSEKEGASSDDGNVPLKEAFKERSSNKKSASQKKKKLKKPSENDSASGEVADKGTSPIKENESEKTKPRKRSKYYVDVDDEDDKRAVPLLDQPPVVEGSRQRRKVIPLNLKPDTLRHGAIPIPNGKGVALGRIPTVSLRFKRLRLDEIKQLHRFMFGKLGDLSYLNANVLNFRGFTFTKDSTEYARKLVLLGKMSVSVLREFLLVFDLSLKIRKKKDMIQAILDFLLCPERAVTTVNPNIISHPKRRATKRNYYEREIEDEGKKPKKAKSNKTKENEAVDGIGETTENKNAAKGKEDENKTEDEESKENNSGADNTNELKKPAKKRKRNQVIDEQTEGTDEAKSKKSRNKESKDESAINDNTDSDVNTTENLSDDELKNFLKKVLADANLEKTTMKTVYSLISKHYPNYNFSKKKDFIKEVVKSAIQT